MLMRGWKTWLAPRISLSCRKTVRSSRRGDLESDKDGSKEVFSEATATNIDINGMMNETPGLLRNVQIYAKMHNEAATDNLASGRT